MCDLVTSSLAVFKAAIRIKSMHLIKSCLKTRTKRENLEIVFLHKSLSKTSFRYRIHNLQRRTDARGSAESRIEYLMPTNNIIVLDSYFNLANKSNLRDRF